MSEKTTVTVACDVCGCEIWSGDLNPRKDRESTIYLCGLTPSRMRGGP